MLSFFRKIAHQNTSKWVVLAIDVVLSAISFLAASVLVQLLTQNDLSLGFFFYPLAIVLVFRLIGFLSTRSYTGVMRYTSIHDAVKIFGAIVVSSTLIFIAEAFSFYFLKNHLLQPVLIVIDAFILVFLMGSLRLGLRLLYRTGIKVYDENLITPVFIYGAGEAGMLVKRSLSNTYAHKKRVMGFIDDNPKLQGKSVEGVKILHPLTSLEKITNNRTDVEVIIAIKELDPHKKKEIIERYLSLGYTIKIIPPVGAWIDGEFSAKNIQNVKIEDLLDRDPIQLDKVRISKELTGKVIMVTGAAGSIGSEIARQCIRFKPKKLILLDQAESPLYDIENELKELYPIDVVIADVCNKYRMEKVFKYFHPQYIFHAAAYKHVPMMEDNPYEAVSTNVFGTQIVADLAVKHKVKKFVFVSTDKAVNPTNIMGASKRIAEIYVQSLNEKLDLENENHTRFVTTRFGNVLGSNGSVIPIFKRQIENGGPITVTHPEITRYFMTIPEACQLVLEAGVMGNGGEIYIFDMGRSVKIVDLAKKMIRLSGLELDKDIKIKFSGLRPGEKLKEELLNNGENTIGTHNPKIMVAQVQKYNYLEVNETIHQLSENKDRITNKAMVTIMKTIVPEFVSNNSVYEELDEKFAG
jgi:FlaA1/EpsC-like NDP-sugar epimerase